MADFPRVDQCPKTCFLSRANTGPVSPLDLANFMVQIAIEDYGQSTEGYAAIVADINAIPCRGENCTRYMALTDVLREMGVFDALVVQLQDPQPPPDCPRAA